MLNTPSSFVHAVTHLYGPPPVPSMHIVGTHYCLAVGNDEGLELDETDEEEEVCDGDEE